MPIPRITDATKSFERLNGELKRIRRLCATPNEIEVIDNMTSCSQWLEQVIASRIGLREFMTELDLTGNVALRNTE